MATDQRLFILRTTAIFRVAVYGRCEALLFRDIGPNMAENSDHVRFIRLTAQIVSAYLGNNSVPSAEIPALWQIYSSCAPYNELRRHY
jgi:hypothetical protein